MPNNKLGDTSVINEESEGLPPAKNLDDLPPKIIKNMEKTHILSRKDIVSLMLTSRYFASLLDKSGKFKLSPHIFHVPLFQKGGKNTEGLIEKKVNNDNVNFYVKKIDALKELKTKELNFIVTLKVPREYLYKNDSHAYRLKEGIQVPHEDIINIIDFRFGEEKFLYKANDKMQSVTSIDIETGVTTEFYL